MAMRVALALSYLTITCLIAYNTLSHVCFFNILGGVNVHMWFQKADAFTRVQFRLECVSDISGLHGKHFEFGGLFTIG